MSDETPPETAIQTSEANNDLHRKESSLSLETVLPINGEVDILDFKSWINWNGFSLEGHKGFDFAAYLTKNGKIMLGLPKNIPVRAIADGLVKRVRRGLDLGETDYYGELSLEHSSGAISIYGHLQPGVKEGDRVSMGEAIGILYSSKNNDVGFLTHLHLQLTDAGGELIDPKGIDERIVANKAEPQGRKVFTVPNLEGSPIEIANFKELIL